MSKSPRPKEGLVEGTAANEGTQAAAAALHTKTQVVKFDDFQSKFFPAQPNKRRPKIASGPSDGSTR